MLKERVNLQAFIEANKRASVIQLIHLLLQGGQSALDYLSQIAVCWKLTLENPDDMKDLAGYYLVWYKPNNRREQPNWNKVGCKSYTVAEYANSIIGGDVERQDIGDIESKLRAGLTEDIVLV